MQGIKNTSNETFRRLFGNGMRYFIPKYQRDYSWDIEQWSDLWYDIKQLINEQESHYMGYLVLQTSDDKNYSVIDGQQRLTTICLIILAGIKHLKTIGNTELEKDENEKRAEALHSSFIGSIDVLSLTSVNKLTLNRNNNSFYSKYLSTLQELPGRNLNSSEKLMKKAFESFYRWTKEEYSTAIDLINFITSITDQLFFTVITVSDELNAFKVFETLNARGVQLSSSDLLKNYIFSIADSESLHKNQLDALEDDWSEIADILKKQQVSEYLRYYWNSTHKTVRKNQLYKTIRDEVKTSQQAFSLIRDMKQKAHIYTALQDPGDELWIGKDEIKKNLELLQLFNVSQPLSLLLSAYGVLDEKNFSSLLSKIVVVSFRYNIICGKNPNEQEIVYNRIAIQISSQKYFDSLVLKDSSIYISDEEFEQSFSYKEFSYSTRNNRIAKYILARLEKFESATSFDLDGYTLEHILPDNPDEESWPWEDRKIQLYRYRLGNMTLLETGKNSHIGNASFSDKQGVYKTSSVPSTRTLGLLDTDEWTEKSIDDRQRKMAKEAKGIWKI